MNTVVQLPTPVWTVAGRGVSPHRARHPASFQAGPSIHSIPACEDDAVPEGGMGRGLSGWLRRRGKQTRRSDHPSFRTNKPGVATGSAKGASWCEFVRHGLSNQERPVAGLAPGPQPTHTALSGAEIPDVSLFNSPG